MPWPPWLSTFPPATRAQPSAKRTFAANWNSFWPTTSAVAPMPCSRARYAVDFDGDGRIDLFNSPADAIGSVANYFKGYGWQTGLPVRYALHFDPERLDKDSLLLPDILPTFSPAQFAAKGAVLDEGPVAPGTKLALIELHNGGAQPSYVAGTDNFYVITRYNWSSYYAMAVIELGEAIQAALPR